LGETRENLNNEDQILVVSCLGRDRPGLVHGVTRVIAKYNANIVDIDQTVLRGLFAMFLLVDISYINDSVEKFLAELKEVSNNLGLVLTIEPYSPGRRKSEKDLYCLTIIGKDKPGIIATFSEIFGETEVNIEQIRMIARGEVIATEMILDVSDSKLSISSLREKLENTGREMGLSLVMQPKYVHDMQKRLIVFDMDNTLVSGEIIDEMAEATGVHHKVKELTSKAMHGEISFESDDAGFELPDSGDKPPLKLRSLLMEAGIGLGYEIVVGAFLAGLTQYAFWQRSDFTEPGSIDNKKVNSIFYYCFMVGSAFGVYRVGNNEKASGSIIATLSGGILGVVIGKYIGNAGVYLGGPVGATIAFNLTRRYKEQSA